MTVAVVYCYPNVQASKYNPLAERFAHSYRQRPPGTTEHQVHVISNGPSLGRHQRELFNGIPAQFSQHNNFGKDIGAFQMAAETLDCDLLVCLGAHIHFWKPGWLDRIVESFLANGPTLYGPWGFHQPRAHIRTTAFWLPRELLRSYPYVIGDWQRYAFEHGENSLTLWSNKSGFPPTMVTWKEVLPMDQWRHIEPQECLMIDQFCDGSRFP